MNPDTPQPHIKSPAGVQVPQPLEVTRHSAPQTSDVTARRSNNLWIKLLVIWLCSWPLSFVITVLARLVFANSDDSVNLINAGVNVLSILLGIYGLMGWVPVLIVALRNK